MANKRLSVEEISKILNEEISISDFSNNVEVEDNEEASDDEGEINFVENNVQSSDEDEYNSDDSSMSTASQQNYFKSNNEEILWYSNPQRDVLGRQPSRNVMSITPGPTRNSIRNVDTVQSAFGLFIKPSIVEEILKWTNKEGGITYGELWLSVDKDELMCFFGLLILAGVFKAHNEAITNLWNLEDGRPIFNKSIARNRSTQISRCIRFDNAESISNIFQMWSETLQDAYIPNENVTVDEQLVTFRGRCPFRQFIPSKLGKYGIKLWAACDSQTYYVINIQVYTCKETIAPREVNQGKRVVLDMVNGLEKIGRNIIADNFFTSLSLARELEKKQLTLVGTIRKNRSELPPMFTTVRGREVYSSLFGFQKSATIVSYCPKKRESGNSIEYNAFLSSN